MYVYGILQNKPPLKKFIFIRAQFDAKIKILVNFCAATVHPLIPEYERDQEGEVCDDDVHVPERQPSSQRLGSENQIPV